MKFITVVLFCLLFSNLAFATDYYVKTGGNDSADGLSDGNAWVTISKLASFGSSPGFNNGDNIKFSCGDTWSESWDFNNSGIEGDHITITSYGSGAKPIIEGDGSDSYSLKITSEEYITIDGLHIKNTRDADGAQGAYIEANGNDIWFDNMQFTNLLDKNVTTVWIINCNGFKIENSDINGGNYGIKIEKESPAWDGEVMDGIVDNNIIHDQDDGTTEEWDGIKLSGDDFTGLVISNNVFYNWQEDGIDAFGGGGTYTVRNNIFRDSGTSYTNTNAMKFPSSANVASAEVTFKDNLIYNITNTSSGGWGLYVTPNFAHKIFNNIIYGYDNYGMNIEGGDNLEIYNNTIIGGLYGLFIQDTLSAGVTVTIKNNILSGSTADISVTGNATVVTGGYNCLINDASVTTADGGTYNGSADDLYATDPLFDGGYYAILTGSPCKDTGTTISSVPDDYRGLPRPQGANYDMGAMEFGSVISISGLSISGLTFN